MEVLTALTMVSTMGNVNVERQVVLSACQSGLTVGAQMVSCLGQKLERSMDEKWEIVLELNSVGLLGYWTARL